MIDLVDLFWKDLTLVDFVKLVDFKGVKDYFLGSIDEEESLDKFSLELSCLKGDEYFLASK